MPTSQWQPGRNHLLKISWYDRQKAQFVSHVLSGYQIFTTGLLCPEECTITISSLYLRKISSGKSIFMFCQKNSHLQKTYTYYRNLLWESESRKETDNVRHTGLYMILLCNISTILMLNFLNIMVNVNTGNCYHL